LRLLKLPNRRTVFIVTLFRILQPECKPTQPFVDAFADLVVLNATLHHCDDMAKVLAEAARLVRPGGMLVTDNDPQVTAWNWKGLGLLLRKICQHQAYWIGLSRTSGDK
jgi:SAM-dependent methyltransferase